MLTALALIVLGLLLLVWSANLFVEGAAAVAQQFGVSPLLVGLIIVGFGTSAPEILVSIGAALADSPGIAIGNGLGSNIANIGLIVGVSALVAPMAIQSITLKRELPLLLAVTLVAIVPFLDGHLSRLEGILMVASLLTILVAMIYLERRAKSRSATTQEATLAPTLSCQRALIYTVAGLLLLLLSSHALVKGASAIASILGVSDLVIGLTIIAIGTSLPELAASVAAMLKKEGDLALGNAIGSNMYNLLAVVGIAAWIEPITLHTDVLSRDYPVMIGMTVLLCLMAYSLGRVWFTRRPSFISRPYGFVLLLCFIMYQGHLIRTALS